MTTVDEASPRPSTDTAQRSVTRLLLTRLSVALTVLGVLVLAAFAPAAHLTANRLPLPPKDPTPITQGTTRPGATTTRMLPLGLPADVRITSAQDVYPYAVAALGGPGAQALMGVLSSTRQLEPNRKPGAAGEFDYAYPYHYAALDPVLADAPQPQLRSNATPLAAALIRLAGQPAADPGVPNAAAAAYAVLDGTRASGGCDAQLNVLLLVAGDSTTSPEILADEYRRSATACPHDPTAGWIVGQTQLRNLLDVDGPRPTATNDWIRAILARALATFQDLAEHYPDDTTVVTGLGDAHLQAGLRLRYSDPFTARHDLQLAVAQYNRAADLGAAHDADLGRARAFIGLGDPERAVQLATRAVAESPRPGAALEVLLAAEQEAHHFDAAQDVARRLERAGPGAYPPPTGFYPLPMGYGLGSLFDATLPLSSGADTVAPFSAALRPQGGAGGSVEDLSFIPQYRDQFDVTPTLTDCPALAWRRAAIVAGRAGQALPDWPRWPARFPASRPSDVHNGCGAGDTLHSIAELAVQHPHPRSDDILTDDWQNLLRWAGDLPGAQRVISRWDSDDGDRSALPALRLGEVAFLQGDYNEAAAQFGVAARRARLLPSADASLAYQARLGRGAALLKAGRDTEAVTLLRGLEQDGIAGYAFQVSRKEFNVAAEFGAVSYHAAVQLADYESATGDLHGAVDDYTLASSWTTNQDFGSRLEVVHNNLALAYLGIGATERAQTSAAKAVHADPMNPVFLMTAGFVADRAGDTSAAADDDRRALASDPGAFAAANDLGVELARQRDDDGAETALRQAVGAAPGYALAWFNLGVLESRRGPRHLLASQGAFARACQLDATLKGRRRELTIDGSVYRTALDLSKPLPPRWSLAQTQKAAPVTTAGLLAVALLGVGLARSSSRRGIDLGKQWLTPVAERLNKIPNPRWLQPSIWAVVATVAAFVLSAVRRPGSPTETVAYALAIVVLGAGAIHARTVVAARAKVGATQASWPPGIAFGVVTGALGAPWAPLPVIRADTESPRVHLAAPLTLAVLSLVLFVEAAWLHVPLTQAVAVAALIMVGSTLLPIQPLDGANLGKAGAVAAAGVIAGAVLVAIGVA